MSYREKYLQFIASFLIVLVLTLPFYTTRVYATINKITVKGSDGIEGYAKANDFMNINVQASISNETIKNEQVVLGSDIKFDKCTGSINNGSECTLRFPSNGTESFEVKSIPFTVNLFKGDKTLDDSKSSTVTIDNKAPQVKLGVPQAKFSLQSDVVVNYEVTEFACDDSSCSNKCVGIKQVEFYTLDRSFNRKVDVATNECTFNSNMSIDSNIFSNGKNSVFAKATDKFNQVSSEASVTFTVDNIAPLIVSNSFAVIRKGISLSTFSPNPVPVEVVANISASDLNLNSVIADLSGLNPQLKNVKASCSSVQENLSTCKWAIDLNPKTGGLKNIIINASDTSGNKDSFAVSKLLSLDDKGPVVLSLSLPSTTIADGTQLVAKASGNTVVAVFDEATGLSADEVFLHVGSSKLSAKSCKKESNWICEWGNVNFDSSTQMSIEADTVDVLGNSIGQLSTLGVTVDKTAPVLKSINITNVGGITPAFPGFFKIGDKIAVIANLTEDNDVFATADFSKFITGASKVAGACERLQADEHVCTWLTDSINLEATGDIVFNFTDNAGNVLTLTRGLKTFGVENTTVPDFWSHDVHCSPKTIDRQLGPLINQRVFCLVSLKQKTATRAVSTVFLEPASCTSEHNIIQNVETLNAEAGTISPILKLTLKKDEFKINNDSVSCTLKIFSRIGSTTTVTKNPEIENVKINIEFFNLPLGELEQEVKDRIKEAKESAEGILKLISTLNKIVFYAKKICQILNIIYTIVVILYVTTGNFKKLEAACIAGSGILVSLGVCGIVKGLADTKCFTTEATSISADVSKKVLNKFCDYVTCKQTILWGDAVKGFINDLPGVKETGKYLNRPMTEYMKPENNLGVAVLFACIPGIIYGLDKYRQILCLHADCLQNAVGKEGLPVKACEDQKAYATCKYVTGEIFALLPWTAVFDYFMGIIKNALSNPFAAIGVAAYLFCGATCPVPDAGISYQLCRGARLLTLVGDAAQNVKTIVDEGFKIRQDYCSRLKDIDEEKPKDEAKQEAKK